MFENKNGRTVHIKYYVPAVEIMDYNVVIDGKNVFDQPVKNNLRTCDNRKFVPGQGDDYTTSCLLDYNDFNNYYKMIAIDLRKQALDADPKATQKISFTGNQVRENLNATMFFIIEEVKEIVLDFSQGTLNYCELLRVPHFYLVLI